MIVSSFVPAVYLEATGKVATFTTGSTNWLKILAHANVKIDDWQDEPDVDWTSLALPDQSIGSVTAAQTFTLPGTVRKLSSQQGDVVRIIHSDGVTYTDYDIVDLNRQKDYESGARTFQNNYIAVYGRTIRFQRAFASTDPQYGGTIYVPGFGYATHIAADGDTIPVDIPNWLVYATAAALDSSDVTRQNRVPDLEAKANQIMMVMKSNNDGQLTRMDQPWRPGGPTLYESAFTG